MAGVEGGAEGEREMVVQKGDTLYALGRRAGVTVPALLAVNPGVDPSKLVVGQTIRVSATSFVPEAEVEEPLPPPARVDPPWGVGVGVGVGVGAGAGAGAGVDVAKAGGGGSAGGSWPASHEVAGGDTLFSIGKRYGVPVDELKRANPAAAGGALSPGAAVALPAPLLAPGWRPCLLGDYDAGVTNVGYEKPWPVGWRTPASSPSSPWPGLTGVRLALALDYFGGAKIGAEEIGVRGPGNRRAPIPGHARLSLDDHRRRLAPVLSALRFVESSNRLPCPDGDAGRSIGPFQIGLKYYADAWAVELQGKTTAEIYAAYQRSRDLAHAEDTLLMYLLRYVPYAVHYQDWETLARCHNGGPNYKNLRKTDRYWWKTRRTLKHGFGAHLRPNRLRLSGFGGDDVRELHAAHCRPPLAPLPEPDIDATPLNPAWTAYGATTLVPHRDVLASRSTAPGGPARGGLRGLLANLKRARERGASPKAFADLALDFARAELEVPEDPHVKGVLPLADPWPPRTTRWPPGARTGPTALVLSGPWDPLGVLWAHVPRERRNGRPRGSASPEDLGGDVRQDRGWSRRPLRMAAGAACALGRILGAIVLPAPSSTRRPPATRPAKKAAPAPLVEHDNARRPLERKRRQFLMDCGLW